MPNGILSVQKINSNKKESYLQVCPIPANYEIVLNCRKEKDEVNMIIITDILGREVFKKICIDKNTYFSEKINTQSWLPGIYFVQYTNGGEAFVKKIEIMH